MWGVWFCGCGELPLIPDLAGRPLRVDFELQLYFGGVLVDAFLGAVQFAALFLDLGAYFVEIASPCLFFFRLDCGDNL